MRVGTREVTIGSGATLEVRMNVARVVRRRDARAVDGGREDVTDD